MKKLILLSFFMAKTFLIIAQNTGLIVDQNNLPIKGANIIYVEQSIMLTSNEKGEFLIDNANHDNVVMQFFKHGYSGKVVKYKKNMPFKVVLNKLHVDLDEVGITESMYELGNSRLTNIERKKLHNNFLQHTSLLESVSELSGVDMISSGLGIQKIIVRGLSGMRVVTYLNGMQINNQQWANDHGIGFTSLGLGEVELIKGSSALKYGSEAIGGLLYFKDSPFIKNEKLSGFVATKFNNSSYLNNSRFGIQGSKNNLFFNLYGEYSISSDYRLPNKTYLFNSRFQQNAIKFSLAHNKSGWHNIFRYQIHAEVTGIPGHVHGDPSYVNIEDVASAQLILSEDFSPTRPTQFVNNQLFVYESKYLTNNMVFSLYAAHYINNLKEYEKWTRPAFDLNLSNTLISPSIKYQSNNLTINIGSQAIALLNKNNIDDRLVPDASSYNFGPYLIADYEKEKYGVNIGVRYDYKQIMVNDKTDLFNINYNNTFTNTSFSSGLYYKYADHMFRFSYSGAYRAPYFAELFSNGVHHGTNRYEIGNDKLKIECANQIDLKYQWADDHFGFIINPFAQYISDFISISPTGSTSSGYKIYNYVQYGKVEIKGVEINLHYHPHQLHNLHLEQSYSFLQTKNKDDAYGLALVPANNVKSKAFFDLSKYSKLLKYRLNYISMNHIFTFSQNSYAEHEEATNSYSLINLSCGIKFSDKILGSIGVNNMLNETYTPHTSRVRGIAGGIPHPGRSFNINLKYEF